MAEARLPFTQSGARAWAVASDASLRAMPWLASAMKALFLLALLAACLVTMPARAAEAQPIAEDPVLEARVMAIAQELRCLAKAAAAKR